MSGPSKERAGLTRRSFLVFVGAAGAGLTLGLPNACAGTPDAAGGAATPFDAYLRVSPDNSVTILSAHVEMGQGITSGIATLVAEELDADPAQMRAEGAAGNTKLYANLATGGTMQETQGSTGIMSSFERYRLAGATARAMLIGAAAKEWGVSANEVQVSNGVISHPSGLSASFGALADAAARLPVPLQVSLKDPKDWILIGTEKFRRLDSFDKSHGRQKYTIDVELPEMLTAMVLHAPKFGGKVKTYDAAGARAVAGVVDVVPLANGVAVLAHNTWAAMKGREALQVEWDFSSAEQRSSDQLFAEYRQSVLQPPSVTAVSRGDVLASMKVAAKTVEATYEFPYLAHAAMEPLDCVVWRQGDRLELWGGFQMPDHYQVIAARHAELPHEKVKMNVLSAGGAFGRRGTPDAQIVVEAIECAKAIGWRAPVKVLWTREDDMTGGRYRPMCLHSVKVGVSADGLPVAWQHRVVGQSILMGTQYENYVENGVDPSLTEGTANTPYPLANFSLDVTTAEVGVPVLWWRSVGHSHNAFVMETLVDELATAAEEDPLEYRLKLLQDQPRHRGVLALAAEKAGWGKKLPAGHFRGIAVHETYGSFVAQVAEIAIDKAGSFEIKRIVAAIDCGVVVNPDQVRAQVEGSIGFGLGAALYSKITLTDGVVDQSNFDSYRVLRSSELPKLEVHIVPSTAPPSGAGEPGVPPVGPAVANALAAATGRRSRVLPLHPDA